MKGLAVLIILLTPILPGESLLTAQDTTHKTAQLACQAPPRDATTGKLIDAANPIFRDTFSPREEVWVALDVNMFKKKKEARLYVIQNTVADLPDKHPLVDVTCKVEEIKIDPIPGRSEGFIYIPVWNHPRFYQDGYDVVIDFKPFGDYDVGQDIVDGLHPEGYLDVKGFHVPEYWVCLESISLNHMPICSYCDAINIRQNWNKDIRPPEWEKSGESYPAAYIKNTCITVKTVFSASTNLNKADIGACRCLGRLGDLREEEVKFNECHDDYKSGSMIFLVYFPTPTEITSFYQEWKWYFKYPETEDVFSIGRSKNKIFVILKEPNSPWKTIGKSRPWTEVLDLACTWAHGETTPEGAAAKIAYYLYNHIGAEYLRGNYSESPMGGGFELTKFLKDIPNVKHVNCVDMAKALVTFSNVLGCGTDYRYCDPFGTSLKCIRAVGNSRNFDDFNYHTFARIGNKIFDPTFYYVSGSTDCPPLSHSFQILADIPWEKYKEKIVKEGTVSCPKKYDFKIVNKK
jgi:hypothetical protein